MAWKTWDPVQKKYVEGYTWSWSSLNPTGSKTTKVDAAGVKNTPTYTNYTKLTGNTPTQDGTPSSKGNTSYVKDAWYHSAGNNWNYKTNINDWSQEAKNRTNEIISHVQADQKTNPGLFAKWSRADFDEYYHYNERDKSQQALLDELYDNANKYWLDSYQNLTADNASQVIMDQNDRIKPLMNDYYNKQKEAADLVKNRLDDRLKPLFNEIQAMQTQWLTDFAELREMQKQYYANVKKEYDAAKAWESASLVSQLSWQGLASGIIGNAVAWQDKVWWTRYNELMRNHIDTLKELTDKTATFMNNIWNTKNNLTNTEQKYLQDWADTMDNLDKFLYDTNKSMIEDEYSPYKAATQAKVEGMNEWLQTQWKRDAKTANYKETDADNRATQITNDIGAQLQITDASKMAKLMTLAKDAWTKFDWNPVDAKNYIYSLLNINPSSKWNDGWNNYKDLADYIKNAKNPNIEEAKKIFWDNFDYQEWMDNM